ncbi:glycoside hydrolase family 5 protein [Erythrobacter sp. EC-HK427]|uniref:glycoside hydrolase family 5 protein n=1 Tax=Erythrobacter sp. EC-HK427 TaxID=2038396 RepID=UPI001253B97A|nr:glycoside hydrolase family 5 protein [Erythrobacter sp. EC-HK427]VVT01271.1 conserved exported hypothetical protein [Erythrobacter sp. EC-HK427]
MRTVTFAAMSLALAFPSQPAFAQAEPLPVGTCINLGNHLESPQENDWGSHVLGPADFARIRAAGFETVRLPVRWANKTGGGPDYTIDPAWMARVTELVDAALAADLNVIMNSHNFEELHADPDANAAKLAAMWRQIAAHFADRSDRLWFEPENEPHDAFTNDNLVRIMAPTLAAIRETNPTRPVIFGGGNWSGIDSLATLDLPDDPNVHPTFHYYAPFDFTHQGATWAGPVPEANTRPYGTSADAATLQADVDKLRAYIARTGMTPFMGETGAFDGGVSLDQRIAYHTAVREAFGPTGVGMCAWAYANTFPFWDSQSETWLPGLRAAFGLPED